MNTNSKQTEVDSEKPVLESLKLKTIKSSNDAQKVSKKNYVELLVKIIYVHKSIFLIIEILNENILIIVYDSAAKLVNLMQ